MTALTALIRRDIRIALRVGGGALIGVLFFLTVGSPGTELEFAL